MTDELKKRVKSLPSLPESFKKIESACNGDGGIDEVAKAIENDPMLVADILKIANSPLYGFSRQIKTVLQAVSLFGKHMTKALVTSLTIKNILKMDLSPYNISLQDFVDISNTQGAIAREWFKRLNPNLVDDIFLCALLQNTGKIILADEIIRMDKKIVFKDDIISSDNVSDVEMNYFETTSILLTADIFEHWEFAQNIVDIIRYSQDPKNAPEKFQKTAYALIIIRNLINCKESFSSKGITNAQNLAQECCFDTDLMLNTISNIKKI
ncbi:HDOD domain-containing signal-transduction protein [Campylobacter pinnipediorum subsp. caledonicus]|uniref:HDOD domain-containing signal-transduction protein n=1 Tax=Campylobacter pinnipediorum subsp. caledonicus TaxID=1874362 RepID=A0A1S6U7G5_9BACT|nr:HDOD domain-containing protein [Campylobacter pinnipediorum]AQW85796.1 HDOD domain-containing signal-transduction protein [Campylobacter pinnipediorum subsp. caledonicus]AQW87407.1 HDOD domain-containing signal-transduction protein [Campylobacter pinnipediorum subsp. caledonicus]